jgi:hypothetical protein
LNKLRFSILLASLIAALLCTFHPSARAQGRPNLSAPASVLPNAPLPNQTDDQSSSAQSGKIGIGNISGTVVDTSGDVVQGAQVQLIRSSGDVLQTKISGSDGQFEFAGLLAGSYKIKVSGKDMSNFTSGVIVLNPGEFRIAPTITLAVSGGSTSVTVSADKEQLAEQQVRIAEQQRIGGVIPNFYSAYDWNAPPMMARQKFKLSLRSVMDPVSFLTVAGVAGAEQYQGLFPGYGSGIEGYGKRYGAALANHFAGEMFSRAVFPSIFHQDPRYFYKGKGSIASRALYAMSRAVVTRTDDGRLQPNYSEVLGDLSAGAISNLYYPQSDRGVSLVLLNGLTGTGANAASNLIREFLLKGMTSHVPKGADGQP